MKTRVMLPATILLVALVSAATTRLVAMRVEVEAMRTLGTDTVMAVVVQVAPEDRSRVGDRAWLQLELSRGQRTMDRVSRAIELDADGQARLEVAWPPGDYDLRVEIESGRGKANGFWIGPVMIPELDQPTPAPSTPTAPPQPAAAEPATAAEPLPAEPETETPVETPAPEPEPAPPAAEPEPAPPAAEPQPEEIAPASEGVPESAEPVALEPAPAVAPEAEPAPTPQPAAPEPAPADSAPTAAPDDTEIEQRLGRWSSSGGDLDEFTVLVTERNQPVLGIGRNDLRVEADGRDVTVEAAGGSSTAPLLLGLAVDLSSATVEEYGEIHERLGRIALQVQGGHGMVFLQTPAAPEPVLDWGATPEQLAQALTGAASDEEADLAGLVTGALARFDERRGRKLLLLVTDGDDLATRGAWNQAEAAAGTAGVPILVIGFRGDGLDNRLKGRLNRLATSSGGKTHFVWESGLLKVVFDYYSDLMEAAYALRVALPRPDSDEPLRLRIEPLSGGYEVLHPKTVR